MIRSEQHFAGEIVMKRMLVLVFLAVLLSFGAPAVFAQFTPEQLAQRSARRDLNPRPLDSVGRVLGVNSEDLPSSA